MSAPTGVIAPVEGDIYYYETMAELDAHEVEGDRARARNAKMSAQLLGIIFVGFVVSLILAFKSAPIFMLISIVVFSVAALTWYLCDLLELCDD